MSSKSVAMMVALALMGCEETERVDALANSRQQDAGRPRDLDIGVDLQKAYRLNRETDARILRAVKMLGKRAVAETRARLQLEAFVRDVRYGKISSVDMKSMATDALLKAQEHLDEFKEMEKGEK